MAGGCVLVREVFEKYLVCLGTASHTGRDRSFTLGKEGRFIGSETGVWLADMSSVSSAWYCVDRSSESGYSLVFPSTAFCSGVEA